jgi:alpha-N-arabinofuranosidase
MDSLITRQTAVMDRYDPAKKLALAVDEWGVWLAPTPGTNPSFLEQQNSLRDAIEASVNLDIFMRHADRVRMANIAQMVNVLQSMILTDGPKMVLTPTYYVYKLYTPFQDATFVPVSYDAGVYAHAGVSLPRVDAVAAKEASGRLWLAVTNIDPDKPAQIEVGVTGVHARSAAGEVLTAARLDSVNTFDAPDAVRPRPITGEVRDGRVRLEIPAKSVAVVSLATGQ